MGGFHTGRIAEIALARKMNAPGIEVNVTGKEPKPEPVECVVEVGDDDIPRQLSVRYASPYFHGGISSMVHVFTDGRQRMDIKEYDLDKNRVRGKGDWEYPAKIEVYWKTAPSRQVRRSLRRGR